jgi:hypothetical protein
MLDVINLDQDQNTGTGVWRCSKLGGHVESVISS